MPRMIGRLAPVAKPVDEMPGTSASALAMLDPPLDKIVLRSTLATMAGVLSCCVAKGEAVTTISSWAWDAAAAYRQRHPERTRQRGRARQEPCLRAGKYA
jgi:hypothetical protein